MSKLIAISIYLFAFFGEYALLQLYTPSDYQWLTATALMIYNSVIVGLLIKDA